MKLITRTKAGKERIIKSDDIPTKFTGIVEWGNGSRDWYKNGKLHREDGPACECANGDKFWYKNGILHREDGPAIKYSNGYKYWFLNGRKYVEYEFHDLINQSNLPSKMVIEINGKKYKLVPA